MRRKVHQVKEEAFPGVQQGEREGQQQVVGIGSKHFNRLDAAVQLQQETAQLEFRAAEENHKWVEQQDAWGTLFYRRYCGLADSDSREALTRTMLLTW